MFYPNFIPRFLAILLFAAFFLSNSISFAESNRIDESYDKVDQAAELYDAEDYKGALKLLNEAIKLYPNNDEAYSDRGDVYFELEEYIKAIRDYNKAIQIDSNYDYYYYSRSVAYYMLDKYREALVDINKALELKPDDKYYLKHRDDIKKSAANAVSDDLDEQSNEEIKNRIREALKARIKQRNQ